MVYQASVVLLDADVPRRSAVPARSARIFPAPARRPRIVRVDPPALAWSPDATIRVFGGDFPSDAAVFIDGVPVDATRRTASEIEAPLPPGILAGIRLVSIGRLLTLGGPVPHPIDETDSVPFLLRPALRVLRHAAFRDPRGPDEKQLSVVAIEPLPLPGPAQRAALYVNQVDGSGGAQAVLLHFGVNPIASGEDAQVLEELRRAFRAAAEISLSVGAVLDRRPEFPTYLIVLDQDVAFHVWMDTNPWTVVFGLAPTDQPGALAFALPPLASGNYLVRLSVDGIESDLDRAADTGKYIGPVVAIP
jgi:hypothetical protein